MNIIRNTRLNRVRIRIMAKGLLPEYNYVRVRKTGVVVFKKHWYSLKRTLTLTTDLVLDALPNLLSDVANERISNPMQRNIFADELYVLLRIRDYKREVDIVGTLWQHFNSLCRNIPTITLVETTVSYKLTKERAWLPVLSLLWTMPLPNIDQIVNYTNDTSSVNNVISKFVNILKRQQQSTRCALPEWNVAGMNFACV